MDLASILRSKYLTLKCHPWTAKLLNVATLRFPNPKFWNLHLYSMDRALGRKLFCPLAKNLRVGADHGVALSTGLTEQEMSFPSETYLIWSSHRERIELRGGQKALRVMHPWVDFRRRKNIKLATERKGTIVFPAHSVPGVHDAVSSPAGLMAKIRKLPPEMGPFTICLHSHDIRKRAHYAYAREGFRVVSVGNSLSPFFIDSFYRLCRRYRFALSEDLGSQLFYLHEFGMQSFLIDGSFDLERPYLGKQVRPSIALQKKISDAFQLNLDNGNSEERDILTTQILGLDCLPFRCRE